MTQWPLSGDIDQIRRAAVPETPQTPVDRKPETETTIAGDRQAWHQMQIEHVGWLGVSRIGGLSWPDQLDPMSACGHAFGQMAHGVGHAVDLGRIGLGDNGDSEPIAFGRSGDPRFSGHDSNGSRLQPAWTCIVVVHRYNRVPAGHEGRGLSDVERFEDGRAGTLGECAA